MLLFKKIDTPAPSNIKQILYHNVFFWLLEFWNVIKELTIRTSKLILFYGEYTIAKSFALKNRKTQLLLSSSGKIKFSLKKYTAATHLGRPPQIWTWPWLGSLISYTLDPTGFIRKNHEKYGDVFTTKILGFNCTFIQSSRYVHSFTTATRKVLDVTAAYKLVAAPLIGEEAFFGQTKYMNHVVLSKNRLDNLDEGLEQLADHLMEAHWSKIESEQQIIPGISSEQWIKADIGKMLEYIIFGLDVFVLIGKNIADTQLEKISGLFNILDSDLSLVGLLKPMLKRHGCPRKRAKDELLKILEEDVLKRIEKVSQKIINPISILDTSEQKSRKASADKEQKNLFNHITDNLELPDILLAHEFKDINRSTFSDYFLGVNEAVQLINSKAKFIAVFIYGFVWAAQTNTAATTVGVVHDILYHDHINSESEGDGRLSNVEIIRREYLRAQKSNPSQYIVPYDKIPHLMHCINETIRLRATGAWIRLAKKPFELPPRPEKNITSVICPKGFIILSPMSISLNSKVYPDPNDWKPERYENQPFYYSQSELSGQEGSSSDQKYLQLNQKYFTPSSSPHSPLFASWGVGQGHCPGKHLAYKMITLTVAKFFEKFDFRFPPESERKMEPHFQDVAAAGVQRLKNCFQVQIQRRRNN
ncbi:cytochrome P450 [Phakopsora pachyrhizi]|nr:cytochrome P450 [Phakopsora pachyrhizi]